jgi:hypothetical protein
VADFTWSFSSLKEYINCPKKYQEVRILKNYSFIDTPQTIYGKEVHEALELYVRDGKPLAKNYMRFKKMVDTLVAIPGAKYPEYKMALTRKMEQCDFDNDNRWVRGIADLVIVDGDKAFIIDYKTGSNRYPDTKQLRLMALMLFEHFPEIKKVKAGLMFLKHKTFITEEYEHKDKSLSWAIFERILNKLDNAYSSDKWMPNPTPLCKWCSVKTCEFQSV